MPPPRGKLPASGWIGVRKPPPSRKSRPDRSSRMVRRRRPHLGRAALGAGVQAAPFVQSPEPHLSSSCPRPGAV